MMKMNKPNLVAFLKNIQRCAVINGKPMPQVQGCIIRGSDYDDTVVEAVSLVRDGITSVSTMYADAVEMKDEEIVIPDIEKLLGALKAHSGMVSLKQDSSKLRIVSANKQTTLTASVDALAFPHTQLTVLEWEKNSRSHMEKINADGYTMKDGSIRDYCNIIRLKAGVLAEAINSGNINGQKVARFTLGYNGEAVEVVVGQELKGQSTTIIGGKENCDTDFTFEATFEGGFENLSHRAEVTLSLLDFTAEGAGIHLVLTSPNATVYQRGIN